MLYERVTWASGVVIVPGPGGRHVEIVHPGLRAWVVVDANALESLSRRLGGTRERLSAASDDRHETRILALFLALVRGGFLTRGQAEDDMMEGWKDEERPHPREVPRRIVCQLMITARCNQRCSFCSVPYESRPVTTDMPIATARRAVELVSAYVRAPRVYSIGGGEPLLHPDCLQIGAVCRNDSHDVRLCTNGTLIRDVTCARDLASIFSAVTISVGGHSARVHDRYRGRGSFALAVKGVKLLKEQGVRVFMRSIRVPGFDETKTKALARCLDVPLEINSLLPLGRGRAFAAEVEHLSFRSPQDGKAQMHPDRRARQGWSQKLRPSLDMNPVIAAGALPGEGDGCAGLRSLLTVSQDGSIHPCSESGNAEHAETFRVGNVWDGRALDEMVKQSAVAQRFVEPLEERQTCKTCFARYHCYAGCPLRSDVNERNCEETREAVARHVFMTAQDHQGRVLQ